MTQGTHKIRTDTWTRLRSGRGPRSVRYMYMSCCKTGTSKRATRPGGCAAALRRLVARGQLTYWAGVEAGSGVHTRGSRDHNVLRRGGGRGGEGRVLHTPLPWPSPPLVDRAARRPPNPPSPSSFSGGGRGAGRGGDLAAGGAS